MELEFRLRYRGEIVGFERFVRESAQPISTLEGQAAIDGDRQGLMGVQQATLEDPEDWFWVLDAGCDGLDHEVKEPWTGFRDGDGVKIYANDWIEQASMGRLQVLWDATEGQWVGVGQPWGSGFEPRICLAAYVRSGTAKLVDGPKNQPDKEVVSDECQET